MIIGTAGHIDHGKSALVTALTGRAMDRLAEEKRRGITIDLNFAPLVLPGLPPVGIVDVPGHEDFVRTMVAGASGIDLVLLVVDGAQGPQPQTWEHLAIVEQLRVPRGIPVITKCDLAQPEWLELVADEVTERLQRSPVEFEAPVFVSALTGAGVAELAGRIRAQVERGGRGRPADGFRMPIDRAFSIAGVGTVVTGTPWSGRLRLGDEVAILPEGLTARVRSLEAYGEPVSEASPGARTAVGLAGIDRAAIRRGEVMVDAKLPWRPTTAFDAVVELLPEARGLRRLQRVRVHHGTAEVLGRVYPRGDLSPGAEGLARIALETPLLVRGDDRFVLRSYSPVATIGGGRILDPLPPRRAPWSADLASPDPARRSIALIARRRDGVSGRELPLLLGHPDAESRKILQGITGVAVVGDRFLASAVTAALREGALAEVKSYHDRAPSEAGLSLETLRRALRGPAEVISTVLDGLIRRGELKAADGLVSLPSFIPSIAGGEALLARVVEELELAGLEPPTVAELEGRLGVQGLRSTLRSAAQQGKATAVESERYFSPRALERFLGTIREVAELEPITPQALRDRLGLSRKFLIPLLEWSDRSGVTRRMGDVRVLV